MVADLKALVHTGAAIVVATRDERLHPQLSRAWGPSFADGGSRFSVCVEAPSGSAMARNLEAGSPVAAVLACLTSHISVHLRGPLIEVGAPTRERLAAVAEHVERFLAEGEQAGMPEAFGRCLVGGDLLDVTFAVEGRAEEATGPA